MSGYVDYDRESGKCAYEAYQRERQREKPVDENWDQLTANMQEAWIAVARAVRERESQRETQY